MLGSALEAAFREHAERIALAEWTGEGEEKKHAAEGSAAGDTRAPSAVIASTTYAQLLQVVGVARRRLAALLATVTQPGQLPFRGVALAVADGSALLVVLELALALGLPPPTTTAERTSDSSPTTAPSCPPVFVPLNPQHPAERLRAMMATAGVVALVVDSESSTPSVMEAARMLAIPSLSISMEALRKECRQQSPPADAAASAVVDPPPTPPQPQTPLMVFFTSGTTGTPRGVLSSHAAMAAYCSGKRVTHALRPGQRVLLATANTFDPSAGDIFSTLLAGATLCLAPRALVLARLEDCVRSLQATHVCLTPAQFSVADTAAGPADLPTLTHLSLGGEKMAAAVAAKWGPALALLNLYGVTEACVYQAAHRVGGPDDLDVLGPPFAGTTFHIQRSEGDEGDEGELVISGEQVALAYLGPDPGRMLAMGDAYRTGDVVVREVDGGREEAGPARPPKLRLRGRRDDQLKINGQRVEAGEICAALRRCRLVTDAFVFLDGRRRLVAAIAAEALSGCGSLSAPLLTAARLAVQEAARAVLPEALVPHQLVVVAAARHALNASGKVDRGVLRELLAAQAAAAHSESSAPPPTTDTERTVADIWEQYIGIRPTSIDDDYYSLGGDSLTALRIAKVLRDRLEPDYERVHDDAVTGVMRGRFAVHHILQRSRLGDYAAHIDGWGGGGEVGRVEGEGRVGEKSVGSEDGAGAASASPLDMTREDALRVGAEAGCTALVDALLDVGADPDGGSTRKAPCTTPLHLAARGGHVAVITLLLDRGASITSVNPNHTTPTHLAAESSEEALRVLLERGAPLMVKDKNKQSILHVAARRGNVTNVELLCQMLPDAIELTDRWRRTPLHWAVLNNHLPVVRALFRHGASPNPDCMGRARHRSTRLRLEMPLHLALRAHASDAALTQTLLEAGADAGVLDSDGNLPLHAAVGGALEAQSAAALRALVAWLEGKSVDVRLDTGRQLHLSHDQLWLHPNAEGRTPVAILGAQDRTEAMQRLSQL